MSVNKNISCLIGNTPLLELERFSRSMGLTNCIAAKIESFNPTGSVKDRAALFMLNAAENEGKLLKGGTVIEPSSGNTGIALAALGAERGYRVIITMPDTMTIERRKLIKAYGAEVVLTEGGLGMRGAIAKAEELVKNIPGAYMPKQFCNAANVDAHRKTTGPEIWRDTDGKIDIFVAGVGSGGTLQGIGECLKTLDKKIMIIAVEPASSPVLSGGHPSAHRIQGIGAGFVPQNLDLDILDGIIAVSDEDAMRTSYAIARTEGLLVGYSSGAAAYAATLLASKKENFGKRIVTLLPDTGERYLSDGEE